MNSKDQEAELAQDFLASGLTMHGYAVKKNIAYNTLRNHVLKSGIEYPRRCYNQGADHPSWKGGRVVDKSGYILLHTPTHPEANCSGYVREHRLVMEKHIGRPLLKKETVHHKNHDKSDNRIENLVLFENNAKHLAEELKGKRPKWTQEGKERISSAAKEFHARHGMQKFRPRLSREQIYETYVLYGWPVQVAAAHFGTKDSTYYWYMDFYGIKLTGQRAHTRLTPLGVQKLAQSQKALAAYAAKSPLFFSHLKTLLDKGDRLPSQMELQQVLEQAFPRSKKIHKKVHVSHPPSA